MRTRVGGRDSGPRATVGSSVLGICFFTSGFASLVLEVVWSRELRLVFGSTTLSVSTILVAYMLGLGLGGLLGGRMAGRVANGVRAYGLVELGIAAYALGVPLILDVFPWIGRSWLYAIPFWPAALLRFALSLVIFLLPTLLMGATLPLLVGAVVQRQERAGQRIGLLYGLNTCGAVGGVMVGTFLLFPTLGLRGTAIAAAILACAAGLTALLFLSERKDLAPELPDERRTRKRREQEAASHGIPLPRWNLCLLSYGAVGFTALVYEVAWTRALSMVLGSSIHAFATMLAAFLGGIALGSLAVRKWVDRIPNPPVAYAFGIAALGILSLQTMFLLPRLPELFLDIVAWLGISRMRIATTHVAVSVLAMLPPTLVLGALFPLLARLLTRDETRASAAVGDVYFVNTLGSAIGAFAGGFLLLPWLGLPRTLILASALNLATAGALALRTAGFSGAWRVAGVGLLLASVAFLLAPTPWSGEALTHGVYLRIADEIDVGIELLPLEGVTEERMLFYRDGLNSTVSVNESLGHLSLRVNGKPDASTDQDMRTQVLLGQVPALFGAPPERVLVIGHGSGVTAGSVARHPVERIDVVELEPAVLEASRLFDPESGAPLDDPRVRIVQDDGRTYLAGTHERYDVIISEPSNPWVAGASSLFTREFFAAARSALRPRGRLLQWLQLYGIDEVGLRAVLASLRAEFPYVYGFSASAGEADLLLLARLEPLTREDLPRWETLSGTVREDLEQIAIFSTDDLLSLLRLAPLEVDALAAEARTLNTDRNLFVELRTPWNLYEDTVPRNWRDLRSMAGGPLALLEEIGEPVDGERLGALALTYAWNRDDPTVAAHLVAAARERSVSAETIATEVLLGWDGLSDSERRSRLDRAVALRPDAPGPRAVRARAHEEAGRYEEAVGDLEAALAARPEEWRLRIARVRLLLALGRPEEAEPDLEALLARDHLQRNPELLELAARARLASDRPREAILFLERLVEHRANFAETWRLFERAYSDAGLAAEADRARRNLETVRRNRALFFHRRALRELWRGAPDEAAATLRLVLAVEPDYEPARRDLARIEGSGGGL